MEVFKQNFNNLWIIAKLFAFDDWKETKKVLKDYFQSKAIENAWINSNMGH